MNQISIACFVGALMCSVLGFLTWDSKEEPAAETKTIEKPVPVDPPKYRVAKYSNGRYVIQYYEKSHPDGYYDIGRPETSDITSEEYALNLCRRMAAESPRPTVVTVLPATPQTAKEGE